MRKKNNLEQRLAGCGDIVTVADLSDKNMLTAAREKEYLDLDKIFPCANPVLIEIGCGKGKFVCETAAAERGVNFIAVEKISNVIIDACERAKSLDLKNVYFLNCAAEVLPKYIRPRTAEVIYLNFSNPLPKEGYKKQRLTHPRFLEIYRGLFYAFSLESYAAAGFKITEVCEDLAAHPVAGDAETEHESLFKSMGKKIFRIVAEV